GGVVESGVVVHQDPGGAGRVQLPRRGAGDDPADDGAHAGDVLVALAVAEAGASGLTVVAVLVAALAGVDLGVLAVAGADAVGVATTGAAVDDVAVHVVPRLGTGRVVADARPVGLPPAHQHRARGAGVPAG